MSATAGQSARWWRLGIWGTTALLLLAAGIARQTVPGFNWTAQDFVAIGLILSCACLLWEIAVRSTPGNWYRAGAGLAISGGLVLTWMNLAVGIIGNEDNPANLVFFGVVALGAAGALLGRLRPIGMARTMTAMALAQAVVGICVLAAGLLPASALSLFFAGLWGAAALLFRKAAKPCTQSTA